MLRYLTATTTLSKLAEWRLKNSTTNYQTSIHTYKHHIEYMIYKYTHMMTVEPEVTRAVEYKMTGLV